MGFLLPVMQMKHKDQCSEEDYDQILLHLLSVYEMKYKLLHLTGICR